MMLTGSRPRLDAVILPALTGHFLDLKHRYFPGLRYPSLRARRPETGGEEVRQGAGDFGRDDGEDHVGGGLCIRACPGFSLFRSLPHPCGNVSFRR